MDDLETLGPMNVDRRKALLEAFAKANGQDSRAEIVAYSISHSELLLRVIRGKEEPIVFRCSGCTRIETTVRWQGVTLSFVDSECGPSRYGLKDDVAGFHVQCSVILLGDPRQPDLKTTSEGQ